MVWFSFFVSYLLLFFLKSHHLRDSFSISLHLLVPIPSPCLSLVNIALWHFFIPLHFFLSAYPINLLVCLCPIFPYLPAVILCFVSFICGSHQTLEPDWFSCEQGCSGGPGTSSPGFEDPSHPVHCFSDPPTQHTLTHKNTRPLSMSHSHPCILWIKHFSFFFITELHRNSEADTAVWRKLGLLNQFVQVPLYNTNPFLEKAVIPVPSLQVNQQDPVVYSVVSSTKTAKTPIWPTVWH